MSPRDLAIVAGLALVVALGGVALVRADGEPALRNLPAPHGVNDKRFATAAICRDCHGNTPSATAMRDAARRPVSPDDLWRPTLLAAAARDPVFRAAVAAESAAAPAGRRPAVEHGCLRCHAPMGARQAEAAGGTIDLLSTTRPERRSYLALDGVSCTVCHQAKPDDLGEPATWNGLLKLDRRRKLYGPHTDPQVAVMRGRIGWTPAVATHLRHSGLCGSCHTWTREPDAPPGAPPVAPTSRTLYLLATYLEWRNSRYAATRGCVDCHMPATGEDGAAIRTRICRDMGGRDDTRLAVRKTYSRHAIHGGGTLALALLRRDIDRLEPDADEDELDAAIAATRKTLAGAASLAIGEARRAGGRLALTLEIRSATGHKLPSGIPLRRLVVRLRVRAGQRVVFASGELDARGRLTLGDALHPVERPDGGVAPHHRTIRRPEQVQIYEAVAGDADGPTALVGRATRWLKDNRLLPAGWSPTHADARATRPLGVDGDPDFVAGGDRLRYDIAVPAGPLTVEAALLFQSVAPRWRAALSAGPHPEARRLATGLSRLRPADLAPTVVASARRRID